MNKKLIIGFAGIMVLLIALLAFFWLRDKTPEFDYAEAISKLNVETTINNLDFQKLELDTLNNEDSGYVDRFKATLLEINNLNTDIETSIGSLEVPDEYLQLHLHLSNYHGKNSQIIALFQQMIASYELIEGLSVDDQSEIASQYESVISLMHEIVALSKEAETEKNLWLDGLHALQASNNN